MSICAIVVSLHDFSQRAEHSAELLVSQAPLDTRAARAHRESGPTGCRNTLPSLATNQPVGAGR